MTPETSNCICKGTGLMFVEAYGCNMPCLLCEAGSAENERRATKPKSAGETKPTPKRTTRKRYCEMCDEWLSKRECPKCGMPTTQAAKEPRR